MVRYAVSEVVLDSNVPVNESLDNKSSTLEDIPCKQRKLR